MFHCCYMIHLLLQDSAMVQMRENMFLEKQKSLEDLRSTLEKDKRDALARAEDKFNHHIKSQSNSIKVRCAQVYHK